MRLSPEEAQKLIDEFKLLGDQKKAIDKRRREISETLGVGRTLGLEADFLRAPSTVKTAYDAHALRRWVPADTLCMCRITRTQRDNGRIVAKLKPKESK